MSVILCLEQYVPRSALLGAERWLYVGDDPQFEIPGRERISIADAKRAAADELRQPYLDAIARLSHLNRGPEWWASHLAAKHPYPSLFSRVCALAAVRELAGERLLVVCSTPGQLADLSQLLRSPRVAATTLARARRQGPRMAIRAGWPVLRALGARGPAIFRRMLSNASAPTRFALERTPGHRRRTLESLGASADVRLRGPRTALLITWLDQRSFGLDGRYRDPHLGPLADMLRKRGWNVASLVKPLLYASFAECARAMVASAEPAVFPDLYVSPSDWRQCERRASAFRPVIPDDLRVGGVPFAAMAREYAREHRRAQADALSHEALVRGLATCGIEPALLVFPWEGHAWEQVLVDAVHRYLPHTQVVGYDNLNFSSSALSLYPAASELDIRPLPDRVVTNGETFASVLRDNGFPTDRVRRGCALRHPHLAEQRPPAVAERSFVLAAGSIDVGQTIELLRKGSAAFGDQLVARLHPASDARAVRSALSGVRFSEELLTDLLPSARLLLYTYSVVPYEALAARTPPVFVRSETLLDLDQLEPTPDVRWVGRTPDELREAARQIESMADRAAWERRAAEVIMAAFSPRDDRCLEQFVS